MGCVGTLTVGFEGVIDCDHVAWICFGLFVGTPQRKIRGKFFVRQLPVLSNIQSRMSAFSKNLFELLGDSDNEAPAAPAPAAKPAQAAAPAVKEQSARPKTDKPAKRGGKSDGKNSHPIPITCRFSPSGNETLLEDHINLNDMVFDTYAFSKQPEKLYFATMPRFHVKCADKVQQATDILDKTTVHVNHLTMEITHRFSYTRSRLRVYFH